MTLDWWDIEITDAIQVVTAETVMATCYTILDINSDQCQAISRLPNGLVLEVRNVANNIASFQTSGVDLAFDYATDLPAFMGLGSNDATLVFRGLATWISERELQEIVISPVIDCAGFMGRGCSGFGNRPGLLRSLSSCSARRPSA